MTPDTLISENLTLLSMPEIVIKLNTMLEDNNCTAADIGNEISLDPALTVRVLKIVNSALYNFPNQIKNIPIAITIMGVKQLRDIVMTASVIKKFQSIPADLVNMNTFWRHSIGCAIAARIIAKHCQFKNTEDFFVMGLLHDIGKLVMYLVVPDQSREVLREILKLKQDSSEADVSNVENSIFGFSHATLGQVLTQQWNMPESLTTPIAQHHFAFSDLSLVDATATLKIADHISNQIQPVISPDDTQIIEPQCLEVLNLDTEKLLDLEQQTTQILEDTLSLIFE